MSVLGPGSRVVLASRNRGKLAELRSLLGPLRVDVVPVAAFTASEAEESGQTFVENAVIKARHAAAASGLPAIADDSGLMVDAMDGAPGVHSARYAGPGATDADNVCKLLAALTGVPEPERTARFACVVVYLRSSGDPLPVVCEGTWAGRILTSPRGDGGFGYDPVFYVSSHGCSSAELAPAVKNSLSHRGQALRALQSRLER